MSYDVVIVGSGLGGLTAGAMLAKKGKKVLVLEQHFIPGGSATVFERKGVKCEVGLHEMDWGTKDTDMKEIIFKKLGIWDTIPIVKLPQTWRIKSESTEYTIPHGRENVKKYLGELFPEEKGGISRYFSAMKRTITGNKALPSDLNPIEFFLYPITQFPIVVKEYIAKATVGQKMDKFFKSNKIKNLLNINLGYFADDPYEFSWFFHASAQYGYYHSAVYIKGGSQVLSNQLAAVITDNGGEIRYLADVHKIELEGNKAVGVTYLDKKTKENITVYGHKIIANCSPDNMFYGKMLPTKFREPRIEKAKPASSLFTIYIIFKEALSKKYANMAYSTFFASEDMLNAPLGNLLHELRYKDINKRGFVLVDYSTIDSGLVPEGDPRGFGVLCGVSNLDEWTVGISKEEYKERKEQLAQSLFAHLETHYPGFKDNIEFYEVSTPKTAQRYLKTPNGTAYGYKNIGFGVPGITRTPSRASQIKNLHFASAWGFPGGGFTGAIVAGYYTALDLICPTWLRLVIGFTLCTISGNLIGFGIANFFLNH